MPVKLLDPEQTCEIIAEKGHKSRRGCTYLVIGLVGEEGFDNELRGVPSSDCAAHLRVLCQNSIAGGGFSLETSWPDDGVGDASRPLLHDTLEAVSPWSSDFCLLKIDTEDRQIYLFEQATDDGGSDAPRTLLHDTPKDLSPWHLL